MPLEAALAQREVVVAGKALLAERLEGGVGRPPSPWLAPQFDERPAVLAAFGSIVRHLTEVEGLWDQAAFNYVAMPRGSRFGLGLRTRVLSPYLFCNSFFYDQRVRGKVPFCPCTLVLPPGSRTELIEWS